MAIVKQTQLIYSSLMAAASIFTVIAYVVVHHTGAQTLNTELISTLRVALGGIALASIGGVLVLKQVLLRPIKAHNIPDPTQASHDFDKKWMGAHIATAALLEAIACYGFVLTLLGKDMQDTLIFTGVSLVSLAIHFPTTAGWRESKKKSLRGMGYIEEPEETSPL